MFKLLEKIVGNPHERKIKKLQPILNQINSYEPELQALSDDELRAKTAAFKEHFTKEWEARGGNRLPKDPAERNAILEGHLAHLEVFLDGLPNVLRIDRKSVV